MKIAICDDDREELKDAEEFCRQTASVTTRIYTYEHAEELKSAIRKPDMVPDLVILDIEMPKESGLDVKEWLGNSSYPCEIIFLTSHEEMMQEAFGRNVIGFLNKSDYQDRLKQIIADKEKALANVVEIPVSNGRVTIDIPAILYIKSADKYSEVYCLYSGNEVQKILSVLTMSQWEKQLPEEFFYRVSRTGIVNFINIESVHKQMICMTDQKTFSIPKGKIRQFRQMYFAYARKWGRSW